ncbi:UDP-N-acetylmuramoyl-L-alanyl-D-glutamate--2,6-diaminopimelate ligase [Fodinicurvata sp. EGI_FJ10296]|uniref:UDP-N-acetylmuramoyl-L-alanyl-D-glutamate--2, 6-diaminopimelate ligase n=1 Tax=Fodinicurvata sp. EGI_FJ10296 TaxID=3231908 RepID=UPI00345212AC
MTANREADGGLPAGLSGLTADSRLVRPGFLFAALPGSRADGRAFIGDALTNGASAILLPEGSTLAPDIEARLATVTTIEDPAPRRRFALMAAAFYNRQPATIAAVTGTNGKTSVASFTRQIWETLGHRSASLGTLGLVRDGRTVAGAMTTPDPVALHADLAELADDGITHLALEASSHGLDQYRLDGLRVTAAAFTNLSHDHLDYHGTMEAYLAAKMRLFTDVLLPEGTAVLNADVPEFGILADACARAGRRVIDYGRAAAALRLADLTPRGDGLSLSVTYDGRPAVAIELPLMGAFQAENALCAAGLAIAGGNDPDDVLAAVSRLTGVHGRMERVGCHPGGAPVVVDFAHTPDALETVLTAVRPHVGAGSAGRLVVVFGCGGDRDRTKRPLMGKLATELADIVYVTDDNPRSEDPATIRAAILAAAPGAVEIGDRRAAIERAIISLERGDVLVIAGKGHETGQIVGNEIRPFDDVQVAAGVISRLTAEAGQ